MAAIATAAIMVVVAPAAATEPAGTEPAAATEPAAKAETYGVPASGVWQVEGRGYGHGRGLGQWSAQAAALQGWSAEQIVNWAYPGTNGAYVGSPTIRVRLGVSAPSAVVRMPSTGGALWIKNGSNGASAPTPNSWYRLTATPDGLSVSDALTGKPVLIGGSAAAAWVEVASADGVHLRNADGSWVWYRGTLRIDSTGVAVVVTDHVGLREYLYGVVPRESPAWFHPQALRAQAFVAASYTLAVARPTATHDICDSTSCQVYGGRAKVSAAGAVTSLEAHSTTAAVDSTVGWILSYGGQPAFTQFSASTGGATTAGSRPYLVARADPFSGQAPKDTSHAWTDALPVSTVERSCPTGGRLVTMTVTSREGLGAWGGRITGLRLDCTTGSRALTGDAARFGLKSSWWRVPGQVQPPIGHVDAIDGTPGAVRVVGWSADPDDPGVAVRVQVYLDDALVRADPAATARPDVGVVFDGLGAAHGFDMTVAATTGVRRACVWAIDSGGGGRTLLGCQAVLVPPAPPLGHLDTAVSSGTGVRVTGWAGDLEAPGSPLRIRIDVDGAVSETSASLARPDVAAVFPALGASHGYDVAIPTTAGTRRVCVTALGSVVERLLGCAEVVVS